VKFPTCLAALLLALSPTAPASVPISGPAAKAGTAAEAEPVPAPTWSWPLDPRPAVLRTFNPPAKPWLSGHRGVDLEAVSNGAALLAPSAGRVSFVGVVVDRPVLTIDHGNGLRSSFEPVASALTVGSAVAEGDVVGQVQPGHCGRAPPCLHWGVRRGDEYVNPLAFVMDLRPSVLLPPLETNMRG
jgi:murein DD-endopeptidase MepM/ murein hydrolase activator NlpD